MDKEKFWEMKFNLYSIKWSNPPLQNFLNSFHETVLSEKFEDFTVETMNIMVFWTWHCVVLLRYKTFQEYDL